MSENFIQYLIKKGYEPQRYLNLNNVFQWVKTEDTTTFSSMSNGGILLRLVKDNSIFHYGLDCFGLPPTLLTPSPQNVTNQSEMIDFISKNANDEIFKKFYNNSIVKINS